VQLCLVLACVFLDQPDDLGEVDVIGFDSLKRGNVVGTPAATRLHGVLQLPELPLVVQAEVRRLLPGRSAGGVIADLISQLRIIAVFR